MSDFTAVTETAGVFAGEVEDNTVEFFEIGEGLIVIEGDGFGEGGFGEGPFGGSQTVIVGVATTVWTEIETP